MALELYRKKQQQKDEARIDNYQPVTVQESPVVNENFGTGSFALINGMSLSTSLKAGERVQICFNGDGGTDNTGWFVRSTGTAANGHVEVRILRNGSEISRNTLRHQIANAGDNFTYIPASSLSLIDEPGEGNFTYTVEAYRLSGTDGGAFRIKMLLKKFNKIS